MIATEYYQKGDVLRLDITPAKYIVCQFFDAKHGTIDLSHRIELTSTF